MAVLTLQNLTRRYGSKTAVDALSLEVPEGSIFGFLGPNGAGKTTAIRVALGFLRPTVGGARVFGLDSWRDSHRIKADAGYLPGDFRFYSSHTLASALKLFGAIRGRNILKHGLELAERYRLDPVVKARAMSRGMRQKLGLVLAMAHRPRLLILDEPTGGLDPITQETLRDHLRELAAAGCTVFFSSHTLSEVDDLCDRVAILRDGKLVLCDTLAGLRARAGHRIVIRWSAERPSRPDLPAGLVVEEKAGLVWKCAYSGAVQPLLRWLAACEADDVTIAPPDLESLFKAFYRAGTSEGVA